MELAQRTTLVARHFVGFQPICKTFCWIRFRGRHALPERGLHVVLEKNGGRDEILRKVPRCGKKIADGHIKSVLSEPRCHDSSHGSVREFIYSKWRRVKQPTDIIQRLRKDAPI